MKLTIKRDRWYFLRELFSYMIPMILIVGTIDVFRNFMICPLHPEWSAPCSVNWIFAIIYWFFLLITIILAIISASKLRKIKKQIEDEFLESAANVEIHEDKIDNSKKIKETKPKIIIAKNSKKDSIKMAKTDSKSNNKVSTKKDSQKRKSITKK